MPSPIHSDPVVSRQLESHGVGEKTGVFGEHKVCIGRQSPVRLDKIQANKIPFAGFRTATKIARGKEGVTASAHAALDELARPGTLNAKKLLGALKSGQVQLERLDSLGVLTPEQKADALWAFAPAVENLSNSELAAVYQTFTSAEMDLLQSALMREGQSNPAAVDARMAASRLFDLQALVLKEVSNRAVRGMLDDLVAANPHDRELAELQLPPRLSEQYGTGGAACAPAPSHDISDANLRTLVEVAAESATLREKTAQAESRRLAARDLPSVSVREMADVLRSAELTININPDILLGDSSIMARPDEPMSNIFHLANQNILPKGEGYLAQRDAAERLLFPELEGHEVMADERPVYGALNIQRRRIGAVGSSSGYGTVAIVLKPEVARRATYIAEDTFYAPVINLAQNRREHFYALLDGSGLSPEKAAALRNADSPEHKALESWFDKLAQIPDCRTDAFKALPDGLGLQGEEDGYLCGLLTDCFGDRAATRRLMATHDNLEALIPHMSDLDGNMLAQAAMQSKSGEMPRITLSGAQYIEAQIHGPLVPSRDIAEIRIDINDFPVSKRATLRARAAEFEQRTGIHVNLVDYDLGTDVEQIVNDQQRAMVFNQSHLDAEALEAGRQDVLENIGEHIQALIDSDPRLTSGLPEGALRVEGNALNRLAVKFSEEVEKELANPSLPDAREIVRQAFVKTAMPVLEHKATLLRALEELPFDTPAQKAAFSHWVCSAKALRSPEELRIIHTHAGEQAALFRTMLGEAPLSPEAFILAMNRVSRQASADLDAFIAGLGDSDFGADDKANEQDRISFMSLALLENGNPPLDQAGKARLNSLLNGTEMSTMLGQLNKALADGGLDAASDFGTLNSLVTQMTLNAQNASIVAGAPFDRKEFTGELSLLPESLRGLIREIAPSCAEILDTQFPGYPPFPTAAHPERLPADDAGRRAFLVKHLDVYMGHEQTFERGTSVHGRGHIARAYIFATVMCNILAEQGRSVDRNAVLCGIAGHDLGRQGGGTDRWEGRSAAMTVQYMKEDFGVESMGQEYEQAVADSIDAHRGQTLEALLLNAADSLDIGRTASFDPERFAFLHGRSGETPSPEAARLRKGLEAEADLLQRLTNPLCMQNRLRSHLYDLMADPAERFMQEHYMQMLRDMGEEVAAGFEKEWDMDSEAFMAKIEKTVRDNLDIFPILSRYYPA